MLLSPSSLQLSTLDALQDWVSHTDIGNFEILLCIGNKVDRVPGHPVHAEYAKRLLKIADSSTDPFSDYTEYGISETEGISLLGDEDPTSNIRKKCLEWCIDHNIEFIEACASNSDFDKCKPIFSICFIISVFSFILHCAYIELVIWNFMLLFQIFNMQSS